MRKFAANLFLLALPAMAEVQIGVDSWKVNGEARYLPDYSVTDWHKNNFNIKAFDSVKFGAVTYSYAFQNDQVNGPRLDRLDADIALNDGFGARVGVLPYRTSWCRTYEFDSPWIAEPDAFCRFSGLNEISRGAFGVQGYKSTNVGGWLVDVMAGIYRPQVDGQNSHLGPYVSVGPTTYHTAKGLAMNALSLSSGTNLRVSWLQTEQNQDDQTAAKKPYARRLKYDTFYLGADIPVTDSVDIRATLAAYIGDQTNPANLYSWDGQSKTIEAVWQVNPTNKIAVGVSNYTNLTRYGTEPVKQKLFVDSQSISWRHQFPDNWSLITQYTNTKDDYTTRSLNKTYRTGEAFGVKIAKTF